MPRPWSEGVALLVAHGHVVAASALAKDRTPAHARRWRPVVPAHARYAVIAPDRSTPPRTFLSRDALARWIHRQRGDQPLDMVETEDLELEDDMEGRLGVHLYTLDAGHSRDRNLGTAWLDGRGLETLKAALRRTDPTRRKDDR